MEKMWAGRFQKNLDEKADDFNSSLRFDCRMYAQDIRGSIAHATMLESVGILTQEDKELIINGLLGIKKDIEAGVLTFDAGEDIHMFVEAELTKRIGDAGKRLHTSRSRNDQVAVDIRLYLRDEAETVVALIKETVLAILAQAEENADVIAPGYTHLQRAQPISFAHQLLAYAMMLRRDIGRIQDAVKRMNAECPLGSCALAGTTYSINREMTSELLGFSAPSMNSIDGVSDRDFCLELLSAFSILMTHLSRLSEEIILWASWEFKFIELDDAYTTGSSIMPQKKNPDMAELIRGKTGRVYGDLMGLLTTLKGLPLAYNKDMQEDKEAIFDALDTVKMCLEVLAPMLSTMKVNAKNAYRAAQKGFINATDLADYLVKKGMPFRAAYKIVGTIVAECIEKDCVLDTYPLSEYQKYSELFADDLYAEISLETCVSKRLSKGGASPASVREQIAALKKEF